MTFNKVAIVTGGGSGLGFAIAQKFVENNITTVIAGRDMVKLNEAKEKLGSNCFAMHCDVSNLAAIPAFVSDVVNTFGKVDILVNNAGINQKKEFTEISDEEFQNIITTNLNAVFSMSREVVKDMLKRNHGCIINIASMASEYGIPKVIAYTASKSAVKGMTRAMATELSPKGIRVNAIAPGFIYSAMTAKALDSDPERKAKVFGRTPMGVMGQPEDIGDAALYLASDSAKYITGVVLPVDGGNSIGF